MAVAGARLKLGQTLLAGWKNEREARAVCFCWLCPGVVRRGERKLRRDRGMEALAVAVVGGVVFVVLVPVRNIWRPEGDNRIGGYIALVLGHLSLLYWHGKAWREGLSRIKTKLSPNLLRQ